MVDSETWAVRVWRANARPEPDPLFGDADDPGLVGEALDGDRLEARPGWRPGRAEPPQPRHLVGGQRVRPGAQQFAGVDVEQQQRGRFDRIPTWRPASIAAPTKT